MSDKKTEKSLKARRIGALVGHEIAERRRALGWTQQFLAEKISVDSVTMSRMETGTSLPSLARLALVAEVLEVGLSELLGGGSPYMDDQVHEIAKCLAGLEPEDRHLLVGLMRQLSKRLAKA